MYRVFNMGIGMVAIVAPDVVDAALASLKASGESTYRIGEVIAGEKGVQGVPS
jgi:phosphoribosylformylglycinamidine cyclo-ligase